MPISAGGRRRIVPSRRPRGLSVVLTPSQRIPDGSVVEVRMGDGRIVTGQARRLDDGKIRVFLPEGAK